MDRPRSLHNRHNHFGSSPDDLLFSAHPAARRRRDALLAPRTHDRQAVPQYRGPGGLPPSSGTGTAWRVAGLFAASVVLGVISFITLSMLCASRGVPHHQSRAALAAIACLLAVCPIWAVMNEPDDRPDMAPALSSEW